MNHDLQPFIVALLRRKAALEEPLRDALETCDSIISQAMTGQVLGTAMAQHNLFERVDARAQKIAGYALRIESFASFLEEEANVSASALYASLWQIVRLQGFMLQLAEIQKRSLLTI